MNPNQIDSRTVAYYVQEAERMRAEALNELFNDIGRQLKAWRVGLVKSFGTARPRLAANLSLPPAHQ